MDTGSTDADSADGIGLRVNLVGGDTARARAAAAEDGAAQMEDSDVGRAPAQRGSASPAPSESARGVHFEAGAGRRKQRDGAADEKAIGKTLERLARKAAKMGWHALAVYVSTETGRVLTGTTNPCLPSLLNLEVIARAALRLPNLAAVLFSGLEADNGRWPMGALERSRQNMSAAALLLKGRDAKIVLASEKSAHAEAKKQKEEEDEAKAAEAAAAKTAAPVATNAPARLAFVREYRQRVSGAERAAKAACAKAVKARCPATAAGVDEAKQVLQDFRNELEVRTEACKAIENTLAASRLSDADRQGAFAEFADEAATFSALDENVFKILGKFSPSPATPSAAGANLVRAVFGEALAAEAERKKGAFSLSASPQTRQGENMDGDEEEDEGMGSGAAVGADAGASADEAEAEGDAEAEEEEDDEEEGEEEEGEVKDAVVAQAVLKRNGVANTGTVCHMIALLQCLANLPLRVLGLYLVPEDLARFLAEILRHFRAAAGGEAAVQTVSLFADVLQKLNDGSPKLIGLAAFSYQWNLSRVLFVNEADYFNGRQQDAPSVLQAMLERLACVMAGRSIQVFRDCALFARGGNFDATFRNEVRQLSTDIANNYATPCPLNTSMAHISCTITTCPQCKGKVVEQNVQRILQVQLPPPGNASANSAAVARASAAASSSRLAVFGSGVPVNLQELVNQSASEMPLHAGEDLNCRQCKKFVPGATRQYLVQNLPGLLVVQLLRYMTEKAIASSGARKGKLVARIRKNKAPISISLQLDGSELLSPLRSSNDGETLYDLAAFVTHIGEYGAGHYTATCRDAKGWRLCDDSVVTSTTLKEADLGNIYMLFYVRRGSGASAHAAARENAQAAAIVTQAQAQAQAQAGAGEGAGTSANAGPLA